jgi:hypothetical protein
MKKDFKHISVLILFAIMIIGGALYTSCKPDCRWYVTDEDGILTGYHDEETCKDWAAEWDDVYCDCI